jgi:hypothetical protein
VFLIPILTLGLAFAVDGQSLRQSQLNALHPQWFKLQDIIGQLIPAYDLPEELGLWLISIIEEASAPKITTTNELKARQNQLAHYSSKAKMAIDSDSGTWTVKEGPWILQTDKTVPPEGSKELLATFTVPGHNSKTIETIQIWKTH